MEQLAIFSQDLLEATQDENLELGERVIHPTEALAPSSGGMSLGPW